MGPLLQQTKGRAELCLQRKQTCTFDSNTTRKTVQVDGELRIEKPLPKLKGMLGFRSRPEMDLVVLVSGGMATVLHGGHGSVNIKLKIKSKI